MVPYFDDGNGRVLYCGDCRKLDVVHPRDAGLLLSDPPYGMGYDTDSDRFLSYGSARPKYERSGTTPIVGDNEPFDPAPWLRFPCVTLWGANHYAARLPAGTTLVWVKKQPHLYGTFLSDAEVGWQNGGCGVFVFDKSFPSPTRRAETGTRLQVHPMQKPESLMAWCIERRRTTGLVFDPYAGSGTTLVAAKALGLPAIGIEIDEKYCRIAAQRLRQELLFDMTPTDQPCIPATPAVG